MKSCLFIESVSLSSLSLRNCLTAQRVVEDVRKNTICLVGVSEVVGEESRVNKRVVRDSRHDS